MRIASITVKTNHSNVNGSTYVATASSYAGKKAIIAQRISEKSEVVNKKTLKNFFVLALGFRTSLLLFIG
jgi:hypothetical protein